MASTEHYDVRPATGGDVDAIAALRVSVLGWDRRDRYVRAAITHGHATVAHTSAGEPVGFRYQHALTPDTLGDGLLLVTPPWRGRGVGRALVTSFEATADVRWALSVVLNTDLLVAATDKPPATGFWVRMGYQLVAQTPGTRLLVKSLPPRP